MKKNKTNCNQNGAKILMGVVFVSIFASASLYSEDSSVMEFSKIWEKIKANSHSQKALSLESRAAKSSKDKASKHWYPRVYADARAFNTNDPAMNFFSTLGQRSARESDFSTKSVRSRPSNFIDTNNNPYTTPNYNTLNLLAPDTLNNPGANTYQRGTLGIDMPLYEGGSKSAVANAYEKQAEGKQHEIKFVSLNEYANHAAMYGTLNSLYEFQDKLTSLEKTVKGIIGRYQLGNRGNPLGYSGGLGLRSLKNRLEGMKEENKAKIAAIRDMIEVATNELPENWAVRSQTVLSFGDEYLKYQPAERSYMAKAMKAYAESAENQAKAEKARILPKVGLFGEGYVYRGDRSTANAYNAGVYVQMNLYSPGDIETIEEANLKSKAMQERALEMQKMEESKIKSLLQMEQALKRNMELVIENDKLMNEQVVVAQQLFGSGALNALQLSEVLSRKADVIYAKMNLESEYLKTKAALLTMSETNLEGVSNE
jgi:outer membrane protein TolC